MENNRAIAGKDINTVRMYKVTTKVDGLTMGEMQV